MAFAPPGSKATPAPIANWLGACHRTKGGPLGNLHNVLLALRNDPAWISRFGYNQMLQTVVNPPDPIEDIDVFRIHEWLQTNGLRKVAVDTVREAVEIVGREHPFHPLRDWLEGLVWDQDHRLPDWLSAGLGCEENTYHASVGTWFVISMIARLFRPGCKADYMLVLEGPQGILKSQAAATLAGPEYYSDSMPDLGTDHVRVSMHLRGKWIIEVSELSAFNRAEASRLKAFLTTQTEQYIPKFGHREVREPRQCVFIGTTNKEAYLLDDTGGRRFWPVKCGTIDLDWLRDNRNQLLAEAVTLFKEGKQWWPDRQFEADHITPVQAARYEADAWDETILKYLATTQQTTLMEVAQSALGFQKHQFRRSEQLRVAGVLRAAGWHDRRGTDGIRFWEP